jgi:hypothetical protein
VWLEQRKREMKTIKTWLLSLSLGLLAACPAWAVCGKHDSPQVSYDKADVVALVELVGETRDNGFSGEFDVLRTWKAELPKRINITAPLSLRGMSTITDICTYDFERVGRYILYIHREKDGTFSTGYAPWNIHESARKAFDDRLRTLEKAAQCGCKGYEKGGFDREYLYKRADVVVNAVVSHVWEKDAVSYANLRVVGFGKPMGFDLGVVPWDITITVLIKEGDSDCGYPVTIEPSDAKTVRRFNPNNYLFYLYYDRDTVVKYGHGITGYSTNICSGNLHASEMMIWNFWQMEQISKAARSDTEQPD